MLRRRWGSPRRARPAGPTLPTTRRRPGRAQLSRGCTDARTGTPPQPRADPSRPGQPAARAARAARAAVRPGRAAATSRRARGPAAAGHARRGGGGAAPGRLRGLLIVDDLLAGVRARARAGGRATRAWTPPRFAELTGTAFTVVLVASTVITSACGCCSPGSSTGAAAGSSARCWAPSTAPPCSWASSPPTTSVAWLLTVLSATLVVAGLVLLWRPATTAWFRAVAASRTASPRGAPPPEGAPPPGRPGDRGRSALRLAAGGAAAGQGDVGGVEGEAVLAQQPPPHACRAAATGASMTAPQPPHCRCRCSPAPSARWYAVAPWPRCTCWTSPASVSASRAR